MKELQPRITAKRTIGSVIKKTLKVIGIIFAIFMTIIIGILWYIDNSLRNYNNAVYSESKFNKEVWLQAEREYNPAPGKYYADHHCVRGKMYHDLKKNYLKKEMALQEIEDLLGKSTVRWVYEEKGKEIECIHYHLGFCSKLGGPSALLVFCPTKSGKWAYQLTNFNDEGYPKIMKDIRGSNE